MIGLISWLACFVAAVTGMAMLHDVAAKPIDRSARGWLRHSLRLAALIGITSTAALICAMPGTRTASLYEVALRCCLAGYMAMQAPCPWWRYVFRGNGAHHGLFDRRRHLL